MAIEVLAVLFTFGLIIGLCILRACWMLIAYFDARAISNSKWRTVTWSSSEQQEPKPRLGRRLVSLVFDTIMFSLFAAVAVLFIILGGIGTLFLWMGRTH